MYSVPSDGLAETAMQPFLRWTTVTKSETRRAAYRMLKEGFKMDVRMLDSLVHRRAARSFDL